MTRLTFRAQESARTGYESALSYLIGRDRVADPVQRQRSKEAFDDIVVRLGPVVDRYPSWHPLVRHHDARTPCTWPSRECGYEGLDHTTAFVNGFITCPYNDGQEVIDSVQALAYKHSFATISAKRLDVQFYNRGTTAVLVTCEWHKPLAQDGTIPLQLALPLLLQSEIPCAEWSTRAETWDSMRTYFLGGPHGSRSSLFVNQETGQAMKKVWEALINTGMFGPIKV